MENHRGAVEQAITDLEYGGIAANEMPPSVWFDPWLTWGGNEEGKEFVLGRGNFGNLLSYENVEKSILWGTFMSAGHLMATQKHVLLDISRHMVNYAIQPSWKEIGATTMITLDEASPSSTGTVLPWTTSPVHGMLGTEGRSERSSRCQCQLTSYNIWRGSNTDTIPHP